jgi:tryptophan synthase
MHAAQEPNGVHVDGIIPNRKNGTEAGLVDQFEPLNTKGHPESEAVPARFGEFGGQYVPESLMDCLSEL